MNKREFLTLSGAVPLMLAGCGSGGSGNAQIRLLNAAVGYPSLDLSVNNATVTSSHVAYGSVSSYATVGDGSQTTILSDTSTSTNLLSTTRTLTKDGKYTVIAYGFEGNPRTLQMTETQTAPQAGFASVSALNTSTDVGPLDVYLTTDGNITNATAIAHNVTTGTQSAFTQVGKGSYYVTVTGQGVRTDVRMVAGPITLADQQISTIVVTPGQSGVLARAVVLTNSSDTTVVLEGTSARVRLVPSFTDGSTTTLTVGTAQADSLVGQAIGAYMYMSVGTATVTVNGTSIPVTLGTGVSSATLVAGSDYTMVVYPTSGGIAATLIRDDNTRPLSAVNFRYRLVHLVNNRSSQVISSQVGNGIISNVQFGLASSYVESTVVTITNADLYVGVSLVATPPASPSVNGVYTLFAFEDDTQVSGMTGRFFPDR